MASPLSLREAEACIKVVRILEQHCDYNILCEFQDTLTMNTDDVVNWLGEIIDLKREGF